MEKFSQFYKRLQEEKLLKTSQKTKDGEVNAPDKKTTEPKGLMKKEDESPSSEVIPQDNQNSANDGILKKNGEKDDKMIFAKPLFNKVQKRREISSRREQIHENDSTQQLSAEYPTGPLDIDTKRIENPQEMGVKDSFGYDVQISPKMGLIPNLSSQQVTIQMNEDGIMKYVEKWDDESIRREILSSVKKNDKEDEVKMTNLVNYLMSQNKTTLETMKDFLGNFNDYYLFWKFNQQMESIEDEYDPRRESLGKKIESIRKKPQQYNEESRNFYDTLRKMGNITINDAVRALKILETIETPRMTYFTPTLEDIIRIYDEGITTVKEIPTAIVQTVSDRQKNPQELNESLFKDVMGSVKDGVGFEDGNPDVSEFLKNRIDKDLGKIVYEFVSKDGNLWNRITDKVILIGYKKNESFTSVDISTCQILTHIDISSVLMNAKQFKPKYNEGNTIPVSLLKTGLENSINFNSNKI